MTPDAHLDQLLAQRAFVQRLAQALLRDRELAADVAQDAMVAAIERPPAVATPMHLRAWLRTVVRRIAAATRADRAERVRREQRAARPESDDAHRRASEQLALHKELTAAVDALPEPYRSAVTLRFLADQKPAAIAAACGTTPHVVSQRIHRGLAMLRERLDHDHGSRTAWATPLAAALPPATFAPLLATTLMAKNAFVAAAVLAVAATGTWLAVHSDAPPLSTTDGATNRSATTAAATANDVSSPATPPPPAATATAARTSAEFTVVVVDAHGAPVEHAGVHYFSERAQLQQSTRADGRAVFPASDGSGSLVVLVRARPPLLVEVPTLSGEQRIALTEDRRVAGRVLVDGEPARAGLQLQLVTDHGEPDRLRMPFDSLMARAAETTTDRQGRFSFSGLPEGWHGNLRLPRTHWVLPQPGQRVTSSETAILLRAPDDDLLVATTRLQTIAGKVVWADDDTPVPTAQLMAYGQFADGSSTPSLGVAVGANGAFKAPFFPAATDLHERWRDPKRRSALVSASLCADAPGSDGQARIELDQDAITRAATEPVVLRLPRARAIHFRAVDKSGRTVAGACVQTNHVSPPTDANGNGTFTGPSERLLVGGPGYEVAAAAPERPAAGTADDPLVFVLQQCSAVTLHVRTATGAAAPRDLRVTIETVGPLFTGSLLQTELLRALGCACAFGVMDHDSGRSQAGVSVDDDGDARLFSLVPAQPCVVTVADCLGTELVRREIQTPARGATDSIDLVVVQTPRRVHGSVAALGGRPIPGARVDLTSASHGSYAVSTSADGAFDFGTICDESTLALAVSAPGFAAQRRDGLRGPVDESFWLEPSRRVAVRIVDDGGALVAVPSLAVRGVPGQPDVQHVGPGEFTVVDLPPRDATFAVTLGGREFACTPEPGATAVELHVPAMARIAFGPLPAGFALPEVGSFGVRGQCLLPSGEPFDLALPRDGEAPPMLPPGRYRFVLVRNEWNAERKVTETTELAAAADLELVAGATATVVLN